MDFGFGKNGDNKPASTGTPNGNADTSDKTDLNGGIKTDENGNPVVDLNKPNTPVPAPDDQNKPKDDNKSFDNGDNKTDPNKPKEEDAPKDGELVEGTVLEVGEEKYTVNATGDVVDKDGNVFKEAKDVADWMKSFDIDNDELSISAIQAKVGIELVDDEGKPLEFENTPSGINAYVQAVIESSKDDVREEAVNTLYQQYPFISDVLNYYIANGNSMEGYGEVPDRSGIEIDDDNEAQQEEIIRVAFKEQGRKGNVEDYIKYLKSSGTLLSVAQEELQGLKDSDAEYNREQAEAAQAAEDARIEQLTQYWGNVKKAIDSKQIAGYSIPDTIVITKDGKRTTATPEQFYNYVYQVDKDGKSAHQKELALETPESRMQDELLRAFLKFTGGNYSNLVGMAINKEQVKTLKLKAAQSTTSAIKITKPVVSNPQGKTMDLGFK